MILSSINIIRMTSYEDFLQSEGATADTRRRVLAIFKHAFEDQTNEIKGSGYYEKHVTIDIKMNETRACIEARRYSLHIYKDKVEAYCQHIQIGTITSDNISPGGIRNKHPIDAIEYFEAVCLQK